MNSIEKLGMGATAIFGTIGIQSLDFAGIITATAQLVIAVGTIIALFRNQKK